MRAAGKREAIREMKANMAKYGITCADLQWETRGRCSVSEITQKSHDGGVEQLSLGNST